MDMTLKEAVELVLGMADDGVLVPEHEQAIRQVAEFFNEYFNNYPEHD